MIRDAKVEDAREIARIHTICLPNDFLSKLGENFLAFLYREMIKNKTAFAQIEQDSQNIHGFATATENTNKLFKKILKSNFVKLCSIVVKRAITKPQILPKVFETLLYSRKLSQIPNLPKAELISIAVLPNFQGKGIGQKLVKTVENSFGKRKIKKYKLTVYKEKSANKFYLALNFKKKGSFTLYGKNWNLYVKNL